MPEEFFSSDSMHGGCSEQSDVGCETLMAQRKFMNSALSSEGGRTSELELLLSPSRQLQSPGGIPDRPTRQSQEQCSAAAKFAQKPFYPRRPPCNECSIKSR